MTKQEFDEIIATLKHAQQLLNHLANHDQDFANMWNNPDYTYGALKRNLQVTISSLWLRYPVIPQSYVSTTIPETKL